MNRILTLALGSVIALGAACADLGETDKMPARQSLLSPVVKDGIIYTPVNSNSNGCMLYRVRIPDGLAPAALMYRSVNGGFSYHRPERCVEHPNAQQ